jgi:hypothetical protein
MFIKYATEFNGGKAVLLEHAFIAEYMPDAPELCVKVYLYGRFLCNAPESADNDIDLMSAALNVKPDDIINAFTYWQEFGLVRLIAANPPEVRYLPVRGGAARLRRFKPEKYADFNNRLQDMFEGRMLTPNEYTEYYNLMEAARIEPDAMLLIARYCLALKRDGALGYRYVLTVARSWAAEGVHTKDDVENKLSEFALADNDLTELFRAMKSRKKPDFDDRRLYLKWTKEMGFDKEAVLYAASRVKGRGGIERLDAILADFYSGRVTTADDMERFVKNRDALFAVARDVTKKLGIYYDNLTYTVETYILPWTNKGFDGDALSYLADYCFKHGIKRLDRVDELVATLAGKGLTTEAAAAEYLSRLPAPPLSYGQKAVPFSGKQYTKEELNSLFNNLAEQDRYAAALADPAFAQLENDIAALEIAAARDEANGNTAAAREKEARLKALQRERERLYAPDAAKP